VLCPVPDYFQSAHCNVLIGAGYDQIDVDACTKHGVRVSNVPTAVDDATADTNMVGCLSKWMRPIADRTVSHFRGSPWLQFMYVFILQPIEVPLNNF
jgi:phosphoglycerate dehydrogenase-like enzyme